MATIELRNVWLHDGDDLSDLIVLPTRQLTSQPRAQASQRIYAGGRVRLVTRPARTVEVRWNSTLVDPDAQRWVADRMGRMLLLRDMRGLLLYGFLSHVETGQLRWAQRADMRFWFDTITRSWEV